MLNRTTSLAGTALSALAVAVLLSAAPAAAAPPVLRCPDDTLHILTSGGEHVRIAVSSLTANPDTSNALTEERVWLASQLDTLELPLRPEGFTLLLVTPRDTVVEVFFHHADMSHAAQLALLRSHARFTNARGPGPDLFKYSAPTEGALVVLREKYALESVAGTGDELSRLKRLMHWVHTSVRHDGNHPNPGPMNSLALLEAGIQQGKTNNCRGLATILNEACLALGFAARHLTCLPADSTDTDCHVVNMVYVRSIEQWVYLDPTHDAWFEDRAGRVLSPAEIRAAMVTGDSLAIPASINWNGQPVTREYYLSYMAKNLFRFACPQESRFGYEDTEKPVQVYLEPLPSPSTATEPPAAKSYHRQRDMHTHDAGAFWARPHSNRRRPGLIGLVPNSGTRTVVAALESLGLRFSESMGPGVTANSADMPQVTGAPSRDATPTVLRVPVRAVLARSDHDHIAPG